MLFLLCVFFLGKTVLALSIPEYTNVSIENAGKYNQLGFHILLMFFLELWHVKLTRLMVLLPLH